MGQSHGRDATLDEALAAIEAIDAAGYLVLRARAAGRLFGTRFRDPNDLVQEALLSVIEGAQPSSRKGRKWPVSVPLIAFLTNAMRGIASNDRESVSTKSEVLATELVGEDGGDADEALATVSGASAPGVDDTLMDAAEAADLMAQRDALFEFFADDDEITMILMAMEDGMRGAAVQAVCSLSQVQYETARTRLRRGKAKMLAQRRDQ